MNRKYSVFVATGSACRDRFCPAYNRAYTMDEMFDHVKSIPLISAIDLYMDKLFTDNIADIKRNLARTALPVASVAADLSGMDVYQKGAFASIDPGVRRQAIEDAKACVDYARAFGAPIMAMWPGQDGYDYLFQADYIRERTLFADALAELCDYAGSTRVAVEYKIKEPRTHSYIGSVATLLLMIQAVGAPNLGVVMDYGHAVLGYESPAEAVALCRMYGDRLMQIHINDNYRLWDDDMIVGSVHTLEYLEFLHWLRRTGYAGYIAFDQFPFREDARDAISESAEWLNCLETMLDRVDPGEIESVIQKQDAIAASRLMRRMLTGAR